MTKEQLSKTFNDLCYFIENSTVDEYSELWADANIAIYLLAKELEVTASIKTSIEE